MLGEFELRSLALVLQGLKPRAAPDILLSLLLGVVVRSPVGLALTPVMAWNSALPCP